MADADARNPDGTFAQGNRFWEARSSHGRNPKFKSADILWDSCLEYFEWVEANPLWEAKPFAYQGKVTIENVAKMRAMTINGLCNFLDISEQAWSDYRKRDADYLEVTTRAENVIRQQKFEGASADLLNANIIARDLGLRDKQEHEHSGKTTVEHEAGSAFMAKVLEAIDGRTRTR